MTDIAYGELIIDGKMTDEEIKLLSQGFSPLFVVPDRVVKWAPLINVSPGWTEVVGQFDSASEEEE